MFRYKNNNLQPIILTSSRRCDHNSVILFTNARDEPNIAEWVAHHLLLGFDKIVVFDHLSKTPIQLTIYSNFNNRLLVIPVSNSGNVKQQLMQTALNMADNQGYSWMIYLDADEFICLNKFSNIKHMLSHFKQADSIGINWLMFGNNGHKSQPKGLLTENFTRSEMRLDKHVKCFVRPYVAARVTNPHYYVVANKNRCYSANGTKMSNGAFNIQPLPFTNAFAYIAHYYIQSEEEHMRRKSRVMDDGSVNKSDMIQDIDNTYNNAVNCQLKDKYSYNIKEFLALNKIKL